jgi:hypothetical protein
MEGDNFWKEQRLCDKCGRRYSSYKIKSKQYCTQCGFCNEHESVTVVLGGDRQALPICSGCLKEKFPMAWKEMHQER